MTDKVKNLVGGSLLLKKLIEEAKEESLYW
jgi:hypothetical protein